MKAYVSASLDAALEEKGEEAATSVSDEGPTATHGETLRPLNAREELSRMAADSSDPKLRALAARLLRQPGVEDIRLWQSNLNDRSFYDLSGRWIKLSADASDWEKMHEMTHSLTAHKLRYGLKNPSSELGQQVAQLDTLRKKAKDAYKGTDKNTLYYLKDMDEFVAGLYSGNSDFIDHLSAIDTEGRSLLSLVMEAICLILGLTTEHETALTRAMGLTDKVMGTPLATADEREEGKLYLISGPSSGTTSFKNTASARSRPSAPAKKISSEPPTRASAANWTTFDGNKISGASRDELVGWLAGLTRYSRGQWFSSRSFANDFDTDLKIYLAEQYFIYDEMISGSDYFKWVSDFKKWPVNFQRDNRVVGLLRDPRSPADFPSGKGFLFTLKDKQGNVLFSKTYFPQGSGNDINSDGVWHKNILEQIEADMNTLPEDKRISISHITSSYNSTQPVIESGAIPKNGRNIFVAGQNSLVSTANFEFVNATDNTITAPVRNEALGEDASGAEGGAQQQAPQVSSPDGSGKKVVEKTHIQGTKIWESDNQQTFSLQGERDLVAGEKILVSVTDGQGLVEYTEITIPAENLDKSKWPTYVASKINSVMERARVGDIDSQNPTAPIGLKTAGGNYLWTTNGEVAEWQVVKGGTAAALPARNNVQWRVPASGTGATTPSRLAFPRPPYSDERLVVWVEDKNSGTLIERLEVPAIQDPDGEKLGDEINKRASHLRVGELSQGKIVPSNYVEDNIFWVDDENYVVKYALVPVETLDKNLQLQQRHQLLSRIHKNPAETRAFFAYGKHHPYTALDRAEINRLLTMSDNDRPGEISQIETELRSPDLSTQQMLNNELWIDEEKNFINDIVTFRTSKPLSAGSPAEDTSFAKAKTDALRYFLNKYPNLAGGTGISSTTTDQHQLLEAVNSIYKNMTIEQQNDFVFATALNWKLATDSSFQNQISTLTTGTTLDLFALREEVITDYETAVSKHIFGNADSITDNFKSREESGTDEKYFKQYADYIKNNLDDVAKRTSQLLGSQSGINSFDMNRSVSKSVKINMKVPVYVENKSSYSYERVERNHPATGDIHLFKTDSGRYFIYSSVGGSVFLKEVKDTFTETELENMLNGTIDPQSGIKLESLFREEISLDDVSTQGGYESFNKTKRPGESSRGKYNFSATIESNGNLKTKLDTLNSAYLRSTVAQHREQNFKLNSWEKFRDAIIPFYKRWSRSSKDPTYKHSDEDSYNDLMSLFGLFSVGAAGRTGLARAGRATSGVLRNGRPASARAMQAMIGRGAQAAAPGLREALKGMATQLASEAFPPLDLVRAARAGVGYTRRAFTRTGNINGLQSMAEGSQSILSNTPFRPQNSVNVDLSDAQRYQPFGYNSVNAPKNLFTKDGKIYLRRNDGIFELDARHGGRTLRVRVPGQPSHTGPEIIHTNQGFIRKEPSGLGGGRSWAGSRIPLGDMRGKPIRGTLGRDLYGQDNPLSKPRSDGSKTGPWPGAGGTMPEDMPIKEIPRVTEEPWEGARGTMSGGTEGQGRSGGSHTRGLLNANHQHPRRLGTNPILRDGTEQIIHTRTTYSGVKQEVTRKYVGRDVIVYSVKGDPAGKVEVSAHGGFYPHTNTMRVRQGETIEFRAPHGDELIDAGVGVPNTGARPHSVVTARSTRIDWNQRSNPRSPGSSHPPPVTEYNARGTSQQGRVRNYKLMHYENDTEAGIAGALTHNRTLVGQGAPGVTKYDIVTIRNRWYSEVNEPTFESVIKTLKTLPNPPTTFTANFCRSNYLRAFPGSTRTGLAPGKYAVRGQRRTYDISSGPPYKLLSSTPIVTLIRIPSATHEPLGDESVEIDLDEYTLIEESEDDMMNTTTQGSLSDLLNDESGEIDLDDYALIEDSENSPSQFSTSSSQLSTSSSQLSTSSSQLDNGSPNI
ncbi:putative adhesin [Collimonas humicola]|uniref:putative adhesin n=1 Tax=Collimonas humicola TaxID=2825886 RepID=UPI001B8B9AE0|nr:hypothetical protein [Collimonas humicola]